MVIILAKYLDGAGSNGNVEGVVIHSIYEGVYNGITLWD